MFGDEESVFDRLWEMIREKFGFIGKRFAFINPLWIIKRPETLTILDYRPTFLMLLTAAGLVGLTVFSVFLFFSFDSAEIPIILWAIVILAAAACVIFLFRGTIREVYYFDTTADSYTFVRQFIHRREVIEGTLSQFTGAYVKTETGDEDSESYFVVLQQEGKFLTGVNEQTLRDEVPMFNSYNREARIASAISGFLPSKR
jgi:hypothetical protein